MSINNFEWLLDSIDAKVVQLNDFLIFELDDNRITFKDISHHFTWSKYVTNQIIEKLCIDIEKVFTPSERALVIDDDLQVITIDRSKYLEPHYFKSVMIVESQMAQFLFALILGNYPGNSKFKCQFNLGDGQFNALVRRTRLELDKYDITIKKNATLDGNEANIRLLMFEFLHRYEKFLRFDDLKKYQKDVDLFLNTLISYYPDIRPYQTQMILNGIYVVLIRLQDNHHVGNCLDDMYLIDFNNLLPSAKKIFKGLNDIYHQLIPDLNSKQTREEAAYYWVNLGLLIGDFSSISRWQGTSLYHKILPTKKLLSQLYKSNFNQSLSDEVIDEFFSIIYRPSGFYLLNSDVILNDDVSDVNQKSSQAHQFPIATAFVHKLLQELAHYFGKNDEQVISALFSDFLGAFLSISNANVLPQINLGISLPAHRGIAVGLKYELEKILPRNVFVHRGIYKTDDAVIQQINYSNYQKQLEVVLDGVPNQNEMIYIRRMVEKCYVDKFISDNPTNNLFEV